VKQQNASQTDQKLLFQEIRNYLAGRHLGATRDRPLLEEVMKCLFSLKQQQLKRAKLPKRETDGELLARYQKGLTGITLDFAESKKINVDIVGLRYLDQKLSQIDLLTFDRDPIGDLYETFIGSAIRGSEGQFFTPQNAGKWIVDAISPASGEMVIDPACGAGGFLVWAMQASKGGAKLYGIEKDSYLASLARVRTAILGVPSIVHSANSLTFETRSKRLRSSDFIESFDVVITNPPFGKNISSVSRSEQKEFALGHKWKRHRDAFTVTSDLSTTVPPQVLFIERIISLLRQGGRAGIVVPESLVSSRSYGHVVQYIRDHAAIRAVVGMPESLFKHSGKGGTHTKTCLLLFEKGKKQTSVFMAEAKWCGHDSRGRTIPNDDLPTIAKDYRNKNSSAALKMGYMVSPAQLVTNILAPRYHEPTAAIATSHLTKTHQLVTVQQLLDDGVLKISSGNEVGKLAYGTGDIPFVRTSDISGWEIKIDPKHCVSQDIYDQLRASQDVKQGDVLMVRDGTYLIGTCAFVTEYDERIIYQSHILKLRSLDHSILSPYLLLALISSEPVQKQIKAKTFTQDIIDSLGSRFAEIVLPIPRQAKARKIVEDMVRKVIFDRVEARELSRRAKLLVVSSKIK
jgi:type I restriction enzyme M protein